MSNFGNIQEKIEQSKLELIKYHQEQVMELEQALKKQNSDLKERLKKEKKKLEKDMSLVVEEAEISRIQLNMTKLVSIILISLFVGLLGGMLLMKWQVKEQLNTIQKRQTTIYKYIKERL